MYVAKLDQGNNVKKVKDEWLGRHFYRYSADVDTGVRTAIVEIDEENLTYKVVPVKSLRGITDSKGNVHYKLGETLEGEEWIDAEEIEMLVASGNSVEEAVEAASVGLCQHCFRANDGKNTIICDRCNSFWHLKCLLYKDVPKGDW
jgi:hypothetical protein